jgi:uncharacterized membrane protein YkvA (DUF1232 family)
MITVISLLILASLMLGRPVGRLAEKLDGTDWKGLARTAWDKIVLYSKKGGRTAVRPMLLLYYVMTEGDLSNTEKALVYAGIIYMAVPCDLLPRAVLNWVGLLDDVAVAAWIFNRIDGGITPAVERKAEETLDKWFGPEYVIEYYGD